MLNEFKKLIETYKNGDEMVRFFTMPRILSSLDLLCKEQSVDMNEVDRLYLSII